MALTATFKRMLDAMAYANLAEYRSTAEKSSILAGCPATVTKATNPKAANPLAARPQVGLYLGSELPDDVMQYALQTCERLNHGLTVLTFQAESEAEALLAPYRTALEAASIELRLVPVTGEPPAPLAQALRRRPEIAFLLCNESGYLGNGLMNGRVRKDAMPVPVVLVTSQNADLATEQDQGAATRVA